VRKLSPLATLALCVTACNSQAAPAPAAVPRATPTPRPTVQVGFDVAVTPASVPRVRKPVRRPTPAPATTPRGPYITLHPSSGPPLATTLLIQAGHLPGSAMVQILWSPRGHKSDLSQTGYTDAKGNLSAELGIAASQPGAYSVSIRIGGVRYASARYTVETAATLAVQVSSSPQGEVLSITGKRFISSLKLALFAYPMVHGATAILLGSVRANRKGSFHFVLTDRKLAPGQYILQAWSVTSLSSQMAESFFEVII
jgi:hypothetical protein